jgi:hypothetical protein
MARAPFGDTLPLGNTTYSSRIGDFISRPVNYNFIGFKPGYALQASELNELQEQFYLQQTLTNRCVGKWSYADKHPFWDGATPLSPDQISTTTNSLTAQAGWYYLIDTVRSTSNSGFGFWIYLENSLEITFSPTGLGSVTSPTRFGFTYELQTFTVSDDTTLHDNANAANVIMTVPGGDRIKVTNFSLQSYSSQTRFSTIMNGYTSSGVAVLDFPTP